MKSWYKEEYCFKIAVVSVGNDGNARHCRNGHKVGDTYSCEFGCPMPQNGKLGAVIKTVICVIQRNVKATEILAEHGLSLVPAFKIDELMEAVK